MSEAREWAKFAAAGVSRLLGLSIDPDFVLHRIFATLDAAQAQNAWDLTERTAEALASFARRHAPGLVAGARLTCEELLQVWGLRYEELAHFFVFLCSDKATYSVGSTYFVDGGMLKTE